MPPADATSTTPPSAIQAIFSLSVIVAALGYFVDIYDLVLFSIVRVPSLKALGFSGKELVDQGVYLLNMQMIGMLLGGILWGVLREGKSLEKSTHERGVCRTATTDRCLCAELLKPVRPAAGDNPGGLPDPGDRPVLTLAT